jgi:UDP-glucose 4-epimerase
MRIAVTGSNGFIGKALVAELLQQNHEVCLLVRNQPQVKLLKVSKLFYASSVFDCETELKNWYPDVFFHLAWRGVNSENRNSEENNLYNIQLTLDTVKLAYNTGCTQWIGCGSQAEYGIKNNCILESDLCAPVTEYGKTKQMLCKNSEDLCNKYGLNYTWARIFSVYGPRDHASTFISYLFDSMLQNKPPQVSSCRQFWDFLFIEDAAKALIALINKNGVYNIASGNVNELKHVVEQIANLTNYFGPIAWNSKPDGKLIHLCGIIDKIKRNSGWQPNVSLEVGLNKTLNYYLKA